MTKVDTTMMAALALRRTMPDYENDRMCPLCRRGHGTPRHVIMACEAIRPLVDAIRNDIEAALVATTPIVTMCNVRQHGAAGQYAISVGRSSRLG